MAHLKEFSTPDLRRNTRALVMRAPTTVTEGTTRRAKICGTTDIRGLAGFLLEPGRTFALHWAPPGCPRVARVDTWLTRAIAFSAIRARPTMLGIALAPAGTSGWVQRTTIRTLSHTLATRPVPGLHGRVLIHAAIAVLHSFLQHQCSIVVCREVHMCAEALDETDLPFLHILTVEVAILGKRFEPLQEFRLEVGPVVCTVVVH